MSKVEKIKKQIKRECKEFKKVSDWFFDSHLLGVEKMAKELLKKFPKANKEIVLLGVWLHDLQRIRGIKGDHAKMGAIEAEKVLKKYKYDENTIISVKKMVLAHRCNSKNMPESIEEKILTSADAMSHYINDFYINMAVSGKRNTREFKKFVLKKMDRDYNKKIQFGFARKMIKVRHDIIKKFFTLN